MTRLTPKMTNRLRPDGIKTTSMNEHYVSNDELLESLRVYGIARRRAKRLHEPKPQVPDYIGECFLKIAERLSRKPNFYGYTFRDEMISDAVENCLLYVDNFDTKKSSNPFSYFTQIIYYAFLRRILREKKHLYVKYKMAEDFLIHQERRTLDDDGNSIAPGTRPFELYENISEYITSFEQKQKTKSKKKRGLEKFISEDTE